MEREREREREREKEFLNRHNYKYTVKKQNELDYGQTSEHRHW